MRRYVGLDVHAASTTFGVISDSGKRLGSSVVETNGQALVEQLKTIPGKKYVCLEEGTQSAWLYEILSPHARDDRAGRGAGAEPDQSPVPIAWRRGLGQERVFGKGARGVFGETARCDTRSRQDAVRAIRRSGRNPAT